MFFALQVSNHVRQRRKEHVRLELAESRLLHWNRRLQEEVNKRIRDLQKSMEQRNEAFLILAHETKTPLTLIHNYMEEYISKSGMTEELMLLKTHFSKLSRDIINLFDYERFTKGAGMYDRSQVTDLSGILSEQMILFGQYAHKQGIEIQSHIEPGIRVKADPGALNRLINNLVENAIIFSPRPATVRVALRISNDKIYFSVADNGPGIPSEYHDKIFQPYFQMLLPKRGHRGMGLGLSIV